MWQTCCREISHTHTHSQQHRHHFMIVIVDFYMVFFPSSSSSSFSDFLRKSVSTCRTLQFPLIKGEYDLFFWEKGVTSASPILFFFLSLFLQQVLRIVGSSHSHFSWQSQKKAFFFGTQKTPPLRPPFPLKEMTDYISDE